MKTDYTQSELEGMSKSELEALALEIAKAPKGLYKTKDALIRGILIHQVRQRRFEEHIKPHKWT